MGDVEGPRRMERPVRWVSGEGRLEMESCEIQQGQGAGLHSFPFIVFGLLYLDVVYTEGVPNASGHYFFKFFWPL